VKKDLNLFYQLNVLSVVDIDLDPQSTWIRLS
jgi:hypothetical protein